VNSEPLQRSGEPRPHSVVTTFSDVTRQRQLEAALKQSETLHRSFVMNQGEGAGIIDLEERFIFANPRAEAIFGVAAGTLAGRSLMDFVTPASAAEIRTRTQDRRQGTRSEYELEVIRESDGSPRTLLVSATPQVDDSGRVSAAFGVFRDITDRKHVENALQESEERLRLATEANRLGTFDIYPQTGKRVWSPLTKQFFGLSPDSDVSFEDFVAAVHPDDRERVVREIKELLLPEHGAKSFSEFRIGQTADGQDRWISSWGRTFFDEQGRPARLIGITQDITERKRAEQAIRESEARLRLTFDQAPIGATMVGLDRRFLRLNDAFCRFLGYEPGELTGSYMPDITHPDHRGVDRERSRELEQGILDQYQSDKRYLRKDGSAVWGRVTLRLVRDESGSGLYFMAMVEDITERKRAEEEREKLQAQLLHAQKMESIGRLAGGVAHDFNNLLTVINGYSTLAAKRVDADDPLSEMIHEIQRAGESAGALVRQLLAFGRRQVLRQERIDLNALVSGLEKTLLPLLGENIEIRATLRPSLSPVIADRHQVEQVMLNLAANARDAMPSGGVLAIETDEVTCEPYCGRCFSPVTPGRYVCITVRDTGAGMDEQTRQNVFEPFFSTKAAGHGTGLGLASVHGIVLQSGGHIDVESQPGNGTSFYIYLPAAEAAEIAEESMEVSARDEARPAGGGTILIVEDEPRVRRLTAHLLRQCGYDVYEAASAENALSKVVAEPVDLVLTDVVLPKMNGFELAAQLSALRCGAKVLFMSGYSEETLRGQAGAMGAILIQKPFAPAALVEKVREILGSRIQD
jgi:PAS domain S-box-containing protein